MLRRVATGQCTAVYIRTLARRWFTAGISFRIDVDVGVRVLAGIEMYVVFDSRIS